MTERTEPEALLKPGEVCELLRIDDSTLRAWSKKGSIPTVRLPSGHRRYRAEDIQAILQGVVS